MTQKTSEYLARTLRDAGLTDLADRAMADEFHDFLSPHAMPAVQLDNELFNAAKTYKLSQRHQIAISNIRDRLRNGEFDASREESDAWVASPDGQDVLRQLTESRKP